MQNDNEAQAMELASSFAKHMGSAGWEPQHDLIEALAYELATAMQFEEDEGIEARAEFLDALQYAAQRIES